MTKILLPLCLPILGYLMGSLSSAVIVSKMMGLSDPRTTGSGNPGATNVLRSGNRSAAILTLIGDLIKGTLAVLFAMKFTGNTNIIALTGLAAFLGHLFPIFFNFKGGKGVATAFGVFVGLSLKVSGLMLLIWLSVAVISRISSLSALVTAAISPVLFALFYPEPAFIMMSGILAGLLFWRHSANISRLREGSESKISF